MSLCVKFFYDIFPQMSPKKSMLNVLPKFQNYKSYCSPTIFYISLLIVEYFNNANIQNLMPYNNSYDLLAFRPGQQPDQT